MTPPVISEESTWFCHVCKTVFALSWWHEQYLWPECCDGHGKRGAHDWHSDSYRRGYRTISPNRQRGPVDTGG